MKKISSVLIVCLLLIASNQTYAQKFGVQAGLNLSTVLEKDDDATYSDDYKMLPGFNAGLTCEIGFGDLIAVQAGLLAETKGYRMKEDYMGGGDYKFKASLLYLDVPILVKVGPSFGPAKVFAAAGPFIGFGLTGKLKEEYPGVSRTDDVEWGDGYGEFKRLDFGAKFGIGAEISKISFGAYYSLGLANLAGSDEDGYKINTRTLSVSAGFRF